MTVSLTTSFSPAEQYFQSRYPGYTLTGFSRDDDGLLHYHLKPMQSLVKCPICGRYCYKFHECRIKHIMDWDIIEARTVIIDLEMRRLRCTCGRRSSETDPDWILPGHRITKRLAAFVQKMLKMRISNSDVSEFTGVGWELIKVLDKAALKVQYDKIALSEVEHIAIDEISIHKGHKYATVVMDLSDRKVLEVLNGKRQQDIRPFLKKLNQKANIKSVSVDMNAGFPAVIKEELPQARLCYDLFHVMQMFNKNVLTMARKTSIERVRQQWKEDLHNKKISVVEREQRIHEQLRSLRNAEWLVVINPDKMTNRQQDKLDQLRNTNALFRDLYPLAELIRQIWRAESRATAAVLLNTAIEVCQAVQAEHKFKPIQSFAEMLKRRKDGILNACMVGFGTNILEGANNTAKVIKRVAYGFRDFEYFALKLKGAFPGRKLKKLTVKQQELILLWDGYGETLGFPQI